jgi:hypothetical protein
MSATGIDWKPFCKYRIGQWTGGGRAALALAGNVIHASSACLSVPPAGIDDIAEWNSGAEAFEVVHEDVHLPVAQKL